MNKEELARHILEKYNVKAEYPWLKYPEYAVFRHATNRKWFALTMGLSKDKLAPKAGGALVDAVNLKCDPILVGSLQGDVGFYPAYHMNKKNWITVELSDRVEAGKLISLLEMSYELTK